MNCVRQIYENWGNSQQQEQNYFPVNDHRAQKVLYTFMILRRYFLINVGKSGVYRLEGKNSMPKLAKSLKMNRQTLTNHLTLLERYGLLSVYNGKLYLRKPGREIERLVTAFKAKEIELIEGGKNQFAALVKTIKFRKDLRKMAYSMANAKPTGKETKEALKNVCNDTKTQLGVSKGVFISVEGVGKRFGKSKATGHRYVKSMQKAGFLNVECQTVKVCKIQDFERLRPQLYREQIAERGRVISLRGRLQPNKATGYMEERIGNLYQFTDKAKIRRKKRKPGKVAKMTYEQFKLMREVSGW